jgi:hypothetical protein
MPEYSQYFVKMANGEALVHAKTNPSMLVIPAASAKDPFAFFLLI